MVPIGVISTKGGVGKTTLTANLGGLLADIGFRTLLIDTDVQPSLSKGCGNCKSTVFGGAGGMQC